MSDPVTRSLHDALDHLKRSMVHLNRLGDLEGLLAAHFDTESRLERDFGWHVYCEPTEWLGRADASLDQAPNLAILGCLLSEQTRESGTVDDQASAVFKANLGRLQQRRNIFLLPNSWALQPQLVLGVALGVKAVAEPSLVSWMIALLEEGISRPDAPLFSRLLYSYALTLLGKSRPRPTQVSQGAQFYGYSIAELALTIWLVKREALGISGFNREDWLDDAHSTLIQRLITEAPCEERSYKAAIIADTALSYVQTRSRYPSQNLVVAVLQNFPAAMERWKSKWQVEDEYDVQSLLWLMLRAVFDDLHYEEYLPKLGRSGQRYDIGLPQLGLIVEVKYVRDAKDFQRIVDEIGKDSAQMQPQSIFTGMVVFVYDESCSVEQHDWACRTLESIALVRRAVIVCAPSTCRPRT